MASHNTRYLRDWQELDSLISHELGERVNDHVTIYCQDHLPLVNPSDVPDAEVELVRAFALPLYFFHLLPLFLSFLSCCFSPAILVTFQSISLVDMTSTR